MTTMADVTTGIRAHGRIVDGPDLSGAIYMDLATDLTAIWGEANGPLGVTVQNVQGEPIAWDDTHLHLESNSAADVAHFILAFDYGRLISRAAAARQAERREATAAALKSFQSAAARLYRVWLEDDGDAITNYGDLPEFGELFARFQQWMIKPPRTR